MDRETQFKTNLIVSGTIISIVVSANSIAKDISPVYGPAVLIAGVATSCGAATYLYRNPRAAEKARYFGECAASLCKHTCPWLAIPLSAVVGIGILTTVFNNLPASGDTTANDIVPIFAGLALTVVGGIAALNGGWFGHLRAGAQQFRAELPQLKANHRVRLSNLPRPPN